MIISFVIGAIVGACIGFGVMALLAMSGQISRQEEGE